MRAPSALRPLASLRTFFCLLPLLLASTILRAQQPAQAAALAGPAARQPNRVLAPADPTQTQAIPGHVPAWLADAAGTTPVPDAETVSLTFILARDPQVQVAFDQLLRDQQDPASPRYHQFLTPAQVGQQFGPTPHDLDALTAWLAGQGFTLDSITPSRTFVQVSAPAATIARALGTTLVRSTFTVGDSGPQGAGQPLQAPTAEPRLPAALAPLVSTIAGLAVTPYRTFSQRQPAVALASVGLEGVTAPAGTPAASGAPAPVHPAYTLSNGTVHWIAPADFAVLYDLKPAFAAGINGAGQRVMVIGGSRLNPTDLANWETISALPAYQPNYIVPTGFTDPGTTNDGNMGEGTLDFNRVYATAPGAGVDMVVAQNWLNGTVNFQLLTAAINTVNDPVMSLSFGACEARQQPAYVRQEDALYAQAAIQGISVLVSSGDSGVSGCETHGAAPSANLVASINDICATSNVTCVGGTEFADTTGPTYWASTNGTGKLSALGYIPEGAWNDPVNAGTNAASVPYLIEATGGGPSTVIAKPSWQVAPGVPADGFRDTPDISFSASGHNAYFSCLAYAGAGCEAGGYITGFGGTSASAPSMAGIAALIVQKLGSRQGNLNPLLYRTYASSPAAFHDPTPASSGIGSACTTATPSLCNNSVPATKSLTGGLAGYPLTPGYDLATGLGSLDVAAFLSAAAGNALATASVALTATPATVTAATGSTVFNATVTGANGTPTGTVTFVATGPVSLTLPTVTLAAGTASSASLLFTTAGTYTITAYYSGDSVYAPASATTTLIVTAGANPPSYTFTAAQSTVTLAAGAASGNTNTVTLTGTNGYTGTFTLACAVSYAGTTTSTTVLPTCTANPATLSLSTTSTTATSTITLTTVALHAITATQHASLQAPPGARPHAPHRIPWLPPTGLFTCIFLAPLAYRRRRWSSTLLTLCAFALLAAAAGCGSGGSAPTTIVRTGTPSGTYTVTVTANSTTGAGTTSTANFTLIVQ